MLKNAIYLNFFMRIYAVQLMVVFHSISNHAEAYWERDVKGCRLMYWISCLAFDENLIRKTRIMNLFKRIKAMQTYSWGYLHHTFATNSESEKAGTL